MPTRTGQNIFAEVSIKKDGSISFPSKKLGGIYNILLLQKMKIFAIDIPGTINKRSETGQTNQ